MEEEIKIHAPLLSVVQQIEKKLTSLRSKLTKNLEERAKLLNEIDSIQIKLEAFNKIFVDGNVIAYDDLVKDIKETNKAMEDLNKLSFIPTDKALTPTDAIKKFIRIFPEYEFTPTLVRDQLEILRNKNLLKTKSDNLLWVAHSSIKYLLKHKIIKKNPKTGTYIAN
jgi:hypothetical protein